MSKSRGTFNNEKFGAWLNVAVAKSKEIKIKKNCFIKKTLFVPHHTFHIIGIKEDVVHYIGIDNRIKE